jgi:ribose transport system substrate-binding protein
MMRIVKARTLLFGVAASAILVGCNSGGNTEQAGTTGGAQAKKTLKITMIAKSNNNPVFQSARVGAEAAAKELGAKENMDIQIDWRTPNEEDGQEQARRIAQAVNEGANVVLISCSDAAKVTGAINDAVDKGVPVMTFDSDAPQSKRFAFYGTNDIECGKQVMKELAPIIGDKGTVAILAGNQNAPNLQNRVKGVQEEAKNHPGITLLKPTYHIETPQDASAEVTRTMNANPSITAWAMIGGWPLFDTSLMSLDPAKVKIVAVDALPPMLGYVDKGIAPVLLAQPVYEWGHKSVEIIVDKVVHNKDVPVVTDMQLERVTKENLGEWAHKLADWGMKVDPKYLK